MTIPNWDFMGSTMVTNNYIRLTPDIQSQQGALWNSIVSILLMFAYVLDIYNFNMKTIFNICILPTNLSFYKLVFIAVPYTKLGTANSIQSTWKGKGLIWRWFCHLVCQGKNEIRPGIWKS